MIHLPVIHRQRQGISQTDMAQRLGVSRRWLIEFEHARVPNPEFSTILSALTELGLSLDVRTKPRSPPNSMNGDTMSENTLNA